MEIYNQIMEIIWNIFGKYILSHRIFYYKLNFHEVRLLLINMFSNYDSQL